MIKPDDKHEKAIGISPLCDHILYNSQLDLGAQYRKKPGKLQTDAKYIEFQLILKNIYNYNLFKK